MGEVQGSKFRLGRALGVRLQVFFRLQGLGSNGLGFRVWGLGFGGLGFGV